MFAPGLGCLSRCPLLDSNGQPEERVRRSCIGTRFVLNLRQSRSGATGKERRENGTRPADEESAFSRRPKLLRRPGLASAANGGTTTMEPGKISGAEGVPAL